MHFPSEIIDISQEGARPSVSERGLGSGILTLHPHTQGGKKSLTLESEVCFLGLGQETSMQLIKPKSHSVVSC